MEEIFGSGDLIAAAKLKELSINDLCEFVRLGGHPLAFTARALLSVGCASRRSGIHHIRPSVDQGRGRHFTGVSSRSSSSMTRCSFRSLPERSKSWWSCNFEA